MGMQIDPNGMTVDELGTKTWRKNGQFHRTNGRPAVLRKDGRQEYYINGERHRTNGPAYISSNGDRYWYQKGLLHNDNGPAIVYYSGNEFYYLKNMNRSFAEWEAKRSKKAEVKSSVPFFLTCLGIGAALSSMSIKNEQKLNGHHRNNII